MQIEKELIQDKEKLVNDKSEITKLLLDTHGILFKG